MRACQCLRPPLPSPFHLPRPPSSTHSYEITDILKISTYYIYIITPVYIHATFDVQNFYSLKGKPVFFVVFFHDEEMYRVEECKKVLSASFILSL